MSKPLILTLLLLLIPSSVLGQEIFYQPIVRPLGSSYYVHKTEHFEIIFEEGSEVEAWETAQVLERELDAAQMLTGGARQMWMPVVMNNSNDQSNGYVHTHPFRQEIEVPHIKGSRLGTKFDSWITAVASHELVHATQADAGGSWGLGKILHWVAPDLARSLNLSLPPGLNEGAAVFFESSVGDGAGRLNDARFQMQFRAAVESEHPWSLSQMMERSRYSFHANRHYIGGANFFAWQHSRDQGEFFKKMRAQRYRNPIRFSGLDLRRTTGQHMRELTAVFQKEMTPDSIQIQSSSRIIAGRQGVLQRWPQWLSDSTLVVYRRGLRETPGLYRIDIHSGRAQLIHAVLLPEDAWFSVRDSVALYSRYVPDIFSTLRSHADVFRYDFQNQQETRLTREGRVHMPIQTTSGIWALQNHGQRNKWVQIDESGQIQQILGRKQADLIQIAPSQKLIALLIRHRGMQGIYLAEPDGELEPWIFLEDGSILEVSWSPDGQFLLFTADHGGVTNVYCYDLHLARTTKLTDVAYGAMDPVLSEDQQTLLFVEYQHERYNIVSIEFSPSEAPPISLLSAEEVPEILTRQVVPEDFTYEPYTSGNRLQPRMLLPIGSWSNETPNRRLGLRGGLGIYGSDPLRRVTYRAEATIQSSKVWGVAEVSSSLGPIIAKVEAFNEPEALIARVMTQEEITQDRTYGEQSIGFGLTVTLPLRFEANVRHSYARISAGLKSEQTRWFSLDENPVPFRIDTGQSLVEWQRSTRVETSILIALGLQQNTRDIWPNQGTIVEAHGRTDLRRESDPRQVGLYMRLNQYFPFLLSANTGMRLMVDLLTQNLDGVYNSSLVLPRGFEAALGEGTYARFGAEVLQPIWFVEDGSLTFPVYIKVLYLYGFAQRVMRGNDYVGAWSAGLGVGVQYRLLHYLDLEIRASINPFDLSKYYATLM